MDSCDKLVFRLQHLIPHGLSSAAPKITNNNIIPLQGPANNHVESTNKSDVPTSHTVRYTMTDGSLVYAGLGARPASATWTQYSTTLIPPAGAAAMTMFQTIQGVGTLEVDNFSFGAQSTTTNPTVFNAGMVSLTFDDGWLSHSTEVLPRLNTAGLKGSFGIISLETLDALPYNRIANPSLEATAVNGDPVDWFYSSYGTNDATVTYPIPGFDGAKAARTSPARAW